MQYFTMTSVSVCCVHFISCRRRVQTIFDVTSSSLSLHGGSFFTLLGFFFRLDDSLRRLHFQCGSVFARLLILECSFFVLNDLLLLKIMPMTISLFCQIKDGKLSGQKFEYPVRLSTNSFISTSILRSNSLSSLLPFNSGINPSIYEWFEPKPRISSGYAHDFSFEGLVTWLHHDGNTYGNSSSSSELSSYLLECESVVLQEVNGFSVSIVNNICLTIPFYIISLDLHEIRKHRLQLSCVTAYHRLPSTTDQQTNPGIVTTRTMHFRDPFV